MIYSSGPNKHVHTPIYSQKKKWVFSPNKIWNFPKNIFTYKSWKKYHTQTFIQDHTVIRATRVCKIWKQVVDSSQLILSLTKT